MSVPGRRRWCATWLQRPSSQGRATDGKLSRRRIAGSMSREHAVKPAAESAGLRIAEHPQTRGCAVGGKGNPVVQVGRGLNYVIAVGKPDDPHLEKIVRRIHGE